MSEQAKPLCHTCRLPFEPSHPSWRKHDTRADCIDSLRAALDQERADNERLRAFAHMAAKIAVEMEEDAFGLSMELERAGLIDEEGNPTALLSGRGEGR